MVRVIATVYAGHGARLRPVRADLYAAADTMEDVLEVVVERIVPCGLPGADDTYIVDLSYDDWEKIMARHYIAGAAIVAATTGAGHVAIASAEEVY